MKTEYLFFFTFSATQADAQKRLQHVKEQKEAQTQLEEVGYFSCLKSLKFLFHLFYVKSDNSTLHSLVGIAYCDNIDSNSHFFK